MVVTSRRKKTDENDDGKSNDWMFQKVLGVWHKTITEISRQCKQRRSVSPGVTVHKSECMLA